MATRVLHIGSADKFTVPLFGLLAKNFELKNHRLLCRVGTTPWPAECATSLLRKSGLAWSLSFFSQGAKADKILIHGLFDARVIFLLFLQPWLLKKCYWIMWGGDLYTDELDALSLRWKITEFFRRPVIRKMGYLITYVKGEVDLARSWYGATGEHVECLMYPSNIVTPGELPHKAHSGTTVLVGNSACTNNNHLDAFRRLRLLGEDFQVACPLSYGPADYAQRVACEGTRLFGENFFPMTDFMALEQYLEFLGRVDIAVFNHQRQQGMGNVITLLGLGKKVYLNRGVTSWEFLNSLGIKVFDVEELSLEHLDPGAAAANREKVRDYFSRENLVRQLRALFA